jgi:sugar phosphate permease
VLWLRESRTEIGAPEPEANPANLFTATNRGGTVRERGLLRPFFTSPAFGLICLVSLIATLVRETFNFWTPTYFHEVAGLSQSVAAGWSAIFPFLGGVSVLASGIASDRMGPRARNAILAGGLAIAALALAAMAIPQRSAWMSIGLVGMVALALLGPYSYLAGAIALDFGGKQGGAMASGLIDAAGYAGAILAGDSVARISSRYGWSAAFGILATLTLIGAAAAGVLLVVSASRPTLARGARK